MMYELKPTNGQKSFYGKAKVVTTKHADILYSYETPIILKNNINGTMYRLWDGWSATTGKHIKAFCGLNKKEFLALELK